MAFHVDASFGRARLPFSVVTHAGQSPCYSSTVASNYYSGSDLACIGCGKGPLSSRISLNRHQKYHCPAFRRAEQPKCQYCREPMSRLDALNRHENKCHFRLLDNKTPKSPTFRRKLPIDMIPTATDASYPQLSPNTPFPDGISQYSTVPAFPWSYLTGIDHLKRDWFIQHKVPTNIYPPNPAAALSVGVDPMLIQSTSGVFDIFSYYYPLVHPLTPQSMINPEAPRFPIDVHSNQLVTPPPPTDAMTGNGTGDICFAFPLGQGP